MSLARQTQSKAQTESNAKILRALVKQPDNKVCADCKRNDPRWASWNLGCFLCIRCSGIHRSMGTHISKVKSIDLDIWTPEQMAAIQKWGNRRANAYWEAHLKAGHIPPEHKVESFIRSKYELRRWAKEGAVPSDPSVLDEGGAAASTPVATTAAAGSTSPKATRTAAPTSALDLLGGDGGSAGVATTSVARPPAKSTNLLDDFAEPIVSPTASAPRSAGVKPTPASTAPASAAAAKPATGGGGGLFDLDWHDGPSASPAATSPTTGAAKGKNDILSLFAASKPAMPTQAPANGLQAGNSGGGLSGLDGAFGGLSMGSGPTTNVTSPSLSSTASIPASNSNPWGQSSNTTTTSNLFGNDPWASSTTSTASALPSTNTADVWGNSSNAFSTGQSTTAPPKNDAFADIWGDFK